LTNGSQISKCMLGGWWMLLQKTVGRKTTRLAGYMEDAGFAEYAELAHASASHS